MRPFYIFRLESSKPPLEQVTVHLCVGSSGSAAGAYGLASSTAICLKRVRARIVPRGCGPTDGILGRGARLVAGIIPVVQGAEPSSRGENLAQAPRVPKDPARQRVGRALANDRAPSTFGRQRLHSRPLVAVLNAV